VIKTEVLAAGVVVNERGFRSDDTVLRAVEMKLTSTARTIKQARRLRGVIQAASTAWEYKAGEVRMMAELMNPWNAAIALGTKFKWNERCMEAQLNMAPFLKGCDRAHIHPDELITNDT
jgi:hypothetical protein